MLAIERRKRIMDIIQQERSVLVPDLSKLFGVTEETIRRDLEKLEKEGFLKRTYGGAILKEELQQDLPMDIREITNIENKRLIAKMVSEYIEDGDTLMIDSSSTALEVIKALKGKKRLTIITNSLKGINELSKEKKFKIICTGGTLRNNSFSFVGLSVEDTIKKYNVDKAIICCKGIHKEKGILESNEEECHVKNAMINAASKVFLAVDNSKFDKVAFVKMMDFNKVNCIFTDKKLSKEWEGILKESGVEVVYCS